MSNGGAPFMLPTAQGHQLAVRDWPLMDAHARGLVVIAHGLGEHAGRYQHVAAQLNSWGFAVRGYDLFGHGRSTGPRGGLPTATRLFEDMAVVLDDARKRWPSTVPRILLGHSMGAQVAAHFAHHQLRPVDALVLSSPAFDPGLGPVQKLLLALLPRLAPDLRLGNGVRPQRLSRDAQTVQAYQQDPLVHDRVSARMAQYIAQVGQAMLDAAPAWKVPTLLMYAGDDQVIRAEGSRQFIHAAPAHVVTGECFATMYHEIFNAPDAGPVFGSLKAWLDGRFHHDPRASSMNTACAS